MVCRHPPETLRQRANIQRREDLAKIGGCDVKDQKETVVTVKLVGNRGAGRSAYDQRHGPAEPTTSQCQQRITLITLE